MINQILNWRLINENTYLAFIKLSWKYFMTLSKHWNFRKKVNQPVVLCVQYCILEKSSAPYRNPNSAGGLKEKDPTYSNGIVHHKSHKCKTTSFKSPYEIQKYDQILRTNSWWKIFNTNGIFLYSYGGVHKRRTLIFGDFWPPLPPCPQSTLSTPPP